MEKIQRTAALFNLDQIVEFLTSMDSSFVPRLSCRLDIIQYAQKLIDYSYTASINADGRIISAIFFYKDDVKKQSYIPLLGTLPEWRGYRYFAALFKAVEVFLCQEGIVSLELETWEGSKALNLYIKNGFRVKERLKGEREVFSVKLLKFFDVKECIPFKETPLSFNPRLSLQLGNNIYIKDDDLFPITGGGSKGRKLHYILGKAVKEGCTAVVTCGSNHSNHLRANAVLSAQLGLKSISIVHDDELDVKIGNIRLVELYSTETIYCRMEEVSNVMDQQINRLIKEGEKPAYIWGGGHCDEAVFAYYDAVNNLRKQWDTVDLGSLDYIFLASGTGTTQAGVHLGAQKFFRETEVIGVSIAREKNKGQAAVLDSINHYGEKYLSGFQPLSDTIFLDEFISGGYGKSNTELLDFIRNYSRNYGLMLDPVYSGKAFYAMVHLLKKQTNKNIVFWNTGAVLNLSTTHNL
jgi:D-cysteine desulfhydrase